MYFSENQRYRVDGSLTFRDVKIGFHDRHRISNVKKREVEMPSSLHFVDMKKGLGAKNFEAYIRYYRYKKDEIFKRMKVTTFVQLLIQVDAFEHSTVSRLDNGSMDPPDTPDLEVQNIQRGGKMSPAPSLALTEGDYGDTTNRSRSTMLGVVRGMGEVDTARPSQPPAPLVIEETPYLLLDIRDSDSYDECHIITGKNYPTAMLSRATNYETKEMLAFKNQPGKIIVIYDEDERMAPNAATTLVQRGYDNLFMLSGGMRIAYKVCPEGLFTGTPNQNITEAPKPPKVKERAGQTSFTAEDINKLTMYIDGALADSSVGSRLSKASTHSSRIGKTSDSRFSNTSPTKPWK